MGPDFDAEGIDEEGVTEVLGAVWPVIAAAVAEHLAEEFDKARIDLGRSDLLAPGLGFARLMAASFAASLEG